MSKLNIALALILLVCALAMVTAQHEARKLFTALTKEQEAAKQYEVEYGQLQLEQSTWAMHARIEKIASGYLRMQTPNEKRLHLVPTGAPLHATQPASHSSARPQP